MNEAFGAENDEGEGHSGTVFLPGAGSLIFADGWWEMVLKRPEAQAAVHQQAQKVADYANGVAATGLDPRTLERTEDGRDPFVVEDHFDPSHTRARSRVKAGSFAGILAEMHLSALPKAAASVGSDPIPVFEIPVGEGAEGGEEE